MKLKNYLFATVVFYISCSNENKTTEISKQTATLKSDVLIENAAIIAFSASSENIFAHLTLSGKSILQSRAILKAVNQQGEEVYCETFAAKELIQPEYKTANSVLKEAHIREVVLDYFVEKQKFNKANKDAIVGI